MMKKVIGKLAAAVGAAMLAGCVSPRWTEMGVYDPDDRLKDRMTLETASKIVSETLADVPAGRRPAHPGDRALGEHVTSIRMRRNERTGLVLVELKLKQKVIMEFYVRTEEDGERFAAAVWRLRREYRGK